VFPKTWGTTGGRAVFPTGNTGRAQKYIPGKRPRVPRKSLFG